MEWKSQKRKLLESEKGKLINQLLGVMNELYDGKSDAEMDPEDTGLWALLATHSAAYDE